MVATLRTYTFPEIHILPCGGEVLQLLWLYVRIARRMNPLWKLLEEFALSVSDIEANKTLNGWTKYQRTKELIDEYMPRIEEAVRGTTGWYKKYDKIISAH